MIDANGWLDWTTKIPGVADKVYTQPNTGLLGLALHSVVGSETGFQDGIPNRFLNTERDAQGRYTPNAAASSMFVLRYSGEMIQMYPVTASTWTSGGREANCSTWAVEAEGGYLSAPGGYDEPLRPAQVATMLRLCGEWEMKYGRQIKRSLVDRTLWEHQDLAKRFGTSATACPSKRYLPLYAALQEELDMTPAQQKMLSDVWLACTGGDAAVLENFNANPGNSLIALALATNQRIAEHEVRPHAGGGHTHEATVTLA